MSNKSTRENLKEIVESLGGTPSGTSVRDMTEDIKTATSSMASVDYHICTASEYDEQTGLPTIQNPDESTFYLVPSGESGTNNLYKEYFYNNNAWELFGSASIGFDLSDRMAKGTPDGSIVEGDLTNNSVTGDYAKAEGIGTVANHKSQRVFGEYNTGDPSTAAATARGNYVEIVGNGTSSNRSNARTLDWAGNEVLAGSLTLGKGTADEVTVTAAQLTALIALLTSSNYPNG